MSVEPIKITLYRWAGSWGPFKVSIPCGECALTADVIKDTMETELAGIPVDLDIRDWLTEWYKALLRGGWHAPIVLVENQIIGQGGALNRGLLTQAVIERYAKRSSIDGTHVFGKASCPHCVRAKDHLDEANIEYNYRDVVANPLDLYEMLARVKPIVGPKTPITVPQIWVNGEYVGGADELSRIVNNTVEPSPDRGQCSMSAT
ncbi:glutaredoxin [Granulosicoccus sp.]|nr:glutaredoxin [Granulosicoccus sp.]MDB4223778.1 glutaredoxin [Granulosicoccus sp.]